MEYYLANINVAKVLTSKMDPGMQDFFDNINKVNQLADNSDGFIWRYDEDTDPLNNTLFGGDEFVVNFSVWKDIDSLYEFTYRSFHADIFRRKKEWFARLKEPTMALWYVPIGHIPTQKEASEKLHYIRIHGPSPISFNFKERF